MANNLESVERRSGDSSEFSYVVVDDPANPQIHSGQASALLECGGEKPGTHRTTSNRVDRPEVREQNPRDRQQTSTSRQTLSATSLQAFQNAALSKNEQTAEWITADRHHNIPAVLELLPGLGSFDPGLVSRLGDDYPIQLATARPTSQEAARNGTPEMQRGIGAWTWDRGSPGPSWTSPKAS